MKKILCLCLCLLLCTGCSIKKDVKTEPLTLSGFATVITTDMNGITLTANAVYDVASGYKFTFSSPQTLKNTTVCGKEGIFTLSGESLNLTLMGDKMPPSMICRALSDCINAVSGALPVENNEYLEYGYSVGGVQCVLYTDEEKNFKKLLVGNQEFIFNSFSYT